MFLKNFIKNVYKDLVKAYHLSLNDYCDNYPLYPDDSFIILGLKIEIAKRKFILEVFKALPFVERIINEQ